MRLCRTAVVLSFVLASDVFAQGGSKAKAKEPPPKQPPPPSATAGPTPATDIFVAHLTTSGGRVEVASPVNITQREGYDNQPAFIDNGHALLFTSVRGDAQADIYRYDLDTKRTVRFTSTAPESEYSATLTPDGRAVSVVRVERDSTQRLWRFPLDGGAPSVILERIKPVGYHAWADDHTLVLFVLGTPPSLQIANTRTGRADTVLTNIGRCLQRIPGSRLVSFVHVISATERWIKSVDPATKAVKPLVKLPEGSEFFVWTLTGDVIVGQGSRLLSWSSKQGGEWTPIADLASGGVTNISRLAISADGRALAIVAVPAVGGK
jgi:dipeptidyl aminopeptidase/acylaminoacyl peptidase